MTDNPTGDLARELAATTDTDAYLAVEAAADANARFTDLEAAAAAVLGCAFAGRAPIYAGARTMPVFTSAVPSAAITVLEQTFDVGDEDVAVGCRCTRLHSRRGRRA